MRVDIFPVFSLTSTRPFIKVLQSQHQSVLKILYFNARSLLPKFDELVLIVHTHIPDVVCITESRLCPEIQESEVSLPGYQLLRLDRDRHGVGVIIYISYKFTVKRLLLIHSLNFLQSPYIVVITSLVCPCSIALLVPLLKFCLPCSVI